jgi:prolyl oligopeptidase
MTAKSLLVLVGVMMTINSAHGGEAGTPSHLPYPPAPKSDVVDDYHGTKVADPYRPLEDPDSPESRRWIEAENRVTGQFLDGVPQREAIRKRLTTLWDYEKFRVPEIEGGRVFFGRNSGLQNQGVVYWMPSLDAEPKELLDANKLSPDGTIAVSNRSASRDGKWLAYALASAGSDWLEWRVRDVETGKDADDLVRWSKFSDAAWTMDGKGFFYGRFDEPKASETLKGTNYYYKLYYHALGTPQKDDKLVFERPDEKEWVFEPHATDDGKYLVILVSKSTDPKVRVFYKELSKGVDAPTVELIGNFDSDYSFIDNDGPVFWFKTDRDAPRRRVVAIDTRKPSPENWREVIPQAAEALDSVDVVGDHFIATYLKDARSAIRVFDLAGKFVRDVDLPGLGSADGFNGHRTDRETFYAYTSFTTPMRIYRYDVATGKSTLFRSPKLAFNPDDYVTRQVFYTSNDGVTRLPMFITHRKDVQPNTGQTPTLLYGYGGFSISLTPYFSPSNLAWMEMGGVLAVPNLRGGGEYGEPWHEAGKRFNKQNVFDDFLSAAEWLINEKITTPKKLAIEGGSNGGLLVGACMTQRPDLFGAVVSAVGVLDMLRFHKFTIGWLWAEEFGSSADAKDFANLLKYSPLHNLKPGTCYPPTLVMTADHDDRVVPAHSFKFAAALQAAQSCGNPTLIRIETKAGHGAGKPTSKSIDEATDKWAFLVKVLGVKPMDPPTPASAAPASPPPR